ncbi:PucR family transcriptional regulator [Halobacillus sp. B23F22_1]|uniref:PucR family transcriptional regulator n=1 Tax=Halobacillus sp. B23F22_1 TaxID=3459514 RepID=UPI00373EFFBB
MSYVDQLKKNYPSLIVYESGMERPVDDYYLFRTADGGIIGIGSTDLPKREYDLLSAFLQPVKWNESHLTEKERQWKNFIIDNKEDQVLSLDRPLKIRLILFSISDLPADQDTFREALQASFPYEMPLIWLGAAEGLIIEEFFESDQEAVSLDSLVDVLMSDFYTKLHFYISEELNELESAPLHYNWAYKCFSLSKKYKLGKVVTFEQIVPYMFIDALPQEELETLKQVILKEVASDRDLLRTIKVFLESGSNTSLAAKLLFMHRNSLQYRVDKFIEKTGVDIKQFQQGLIVYLLLLENSL